MALADNNTPIICNGFKDDEYIQIAGESLKAENGRYEIRVTEELAEVAYLDQVRLIAVDPVHIDLSDHGGPGFRATTLAASATAARIDVRTRIARAGPGGGAVRITASLIDAAGRVAATARAGSTRLPIDRPSHRSIEPSAPKARLRKYAASVSPPVSLRCLLGLSLVDPVRFLRAGFLFRGAACRRRDCPMPPAVAR